MTYKREIDGLRAIAVVSVVLYHAGLGGAGFVGVDIFFVISGYLITSLLLREQGIDLFAFYGRRVRRIFPAAFAVVVTTLAASALILPPADLAHTANSAAAAALFVANFFFQGVTGGYFDTRSEAMPLLHLWSLSVEEQFYLIWPALLMVLLRYQVKLAPVLSGLALASFAAANLTDPQTAFYQMPPRFWELAVGGLVALAPVREPPRWLIGAALSILAVAIVVPLTPFPGTGALPAVLGAAMVLLAVHGGATSRLLASKPFVGIGLISYSLYLWHWPLLALNRAGVVSESVPMNLALCAFALVLAIASYRYIEQPFRRVKWPTRKLVFGGAAVSLTLALSAAATAQRIDILPIEDRALAVIAENDVPPNQEACMHLHPAPPCETGPNPKTVVWGDSFASRWQVLADGPVAVYSMGGCPPFLDYTLISPKPGQSAECAQYARDIAAGIDRFDTVVLATHWLKYAMHGPKDERPQREARMEAGLNATLDRLQGKRVLIVAQTPILKNLAPLCIRSESDCGPKRATFDADTRSIRDMLARAAQTHPNVEIVDPVDYLCSATDCPVVRRGIAQYSDAEHVSYTAAVGFAADRVQ